MSFFFGRRHSVSGAPAEDDGVPRNPNLRLRRRASVPNAPSQTRGTHDRNVFQDLFRRHRDDSESEMSTVERDHGSTHANQSKQSTATAAKSHTGSQSSPHAHEPSAKGHNQEGVHNATPSSEYALSKKEIETLFSGAPFFLLERGKYDHHYPQVIFPFDDHDPTIQNLWDRKPLPHPSYTLCTLHAHLPVPDRWVISKDEPIHLNSWKKTGGAKRATFDIGIFEVPNMLSMNGKDPGAVGFRHFLELPVADAVRYPEEPKGKLNYIQLSSIPASEVYELMEHYHDVYALSGGAPYDRKQLLCDGPSAWKKIGVRDINLQCLVERLRTLTNLRRELLHGKKATTILDTESTRDLYSGLFTKFLYPPSKPLLADSSLAHSLKSQIKALTMTLAARNAWVDFSLPEWRLYAGQLLWEAGPHPDGDLLDPSTCSKPWMHPTLERRWLLIQMLLAAELLLRLDATVRVGILDNSKELQITVQDIDDFEKLRSGKVDWDLVVVRRFMDTFDISYRADEPDHPGFDPVEHTGNSRGEKNHEKNSRSFFENLLHRSLSGSAAESTESAWNCSLVPTYLDQQLQGLLVFGQEIGWPGLDGLRAGLESAIGSGQMSEAVTNTYNKPVHNMLPAEAGAPLSKEEMHTRSPSRRWIALHCSQDQKASVQLGGWITRSWLSGFVFPGEQISHLLMATILENDSDALAKLGPIANLYGGFAYNGMTWWSKECVVGRVLASLEDTKECLGWIRSAVVPKDAWTVQPLDNSWFEVSVQPPLSMPGKPRIRQGNKLAYESTPLGRGERVSGAFSLPLDSPLEKEPKNVVFETLTFSGKDGQSLENTPHPIVDRALMTFSIASGTDSPWKVSFQLRYNVRFITSHECRPPGNFISYHCACPTGSGTSTPSSSSSPRHHHRLPGHPLHSGYKYKHISLDSLPEHCVPDDAFLEGSHHNNHSNHSNHHKKHEVLIVDARGGHDRETFARAWCASLGYHALIGRVGRTCLACCIREARAISVKVVLRVDGGVNRSPYPSSQTLPGLKEI
ncbi:hypothetical protein AO1008_03576 [Aspergillus oryzae 100-8]|uniref:Uncharacterized protein n=1 Tax=Aspergillus oryzae (strain 3.042) TaxID=1160506 RepID=I7ZLH9_ASPO3|nr:hypothetical protein Ao3042_01133 [Aspergillus oryzae 3.042]KDE77418.1 hypothetical protein AO1008_03576 [Aspergillus oryzae 100-8]|eukprot:EIT72647.1 hypothetical protein Ao3042_01133 [Aspergillus oryzae 3.042]